MRKVFLGLVVVFATAFVFTSCTSKVETLKRVIEQTKKELGLPVTMNGVLVKDLVFETATNSMNTIIEVPAEDFDNLAFMLTQPVYKESILFSKKDNASVKELAKLLVDVKGSLKYTYQIADGSKTPIELVYGVDDLKKLVTGTLQQPDMSQLKQPEQSQQTEMQESQDAEEMRDRSEASEE